MKSDVSSKILKFCRTYILLILFILSSQLVYTQQADLTENDIIEQADKLFDAKDYQGAIPLYAQLVSVHPDEALYNYRFGVCSLFGDRKDKKKPIRYLSYAALSMTDNPELFYNLGLAFHQNQEFANAMKYYNLYLAKLAPDAPERPKILEKVNACLNGLTMAHKHLISEIISQSEFQKDNFHRAYSATDLNGSLVIKPDMFKTSKEKKSGEQSYVFISDPRTILYYSGYGEDDANNKEIFKVVMNEKGDWDKPEKISEIINTPFDEDYPVLTDNGTTLYFCSKGHNALGGYDVFKSSLDTANNTFSQPENLGSDINSPFDDILFILDKEGKCAYFASDRDNLNGSINVYKVRLLEGQLDNQHFLAHEQNLKNAFPSQKVEQKETPDESQNLIANNENENQDQQTRAQPSSNPSEKAANMMSDRTKSHKLADSAYLVISSTKTLVRDLTNKRDRANAISKRKSDEAKELERRFDECISGLALIGGEVEFQKELDRGVKFKEEICQLYERSNEANQIAWNLGRQIKTKNKELVDLKTNAGKIQSTSVSKTYEETLVLYSAFMRQFRAADTLTGFSEKVMAITNNEAKYEIPEKEFAFAATLLEAFKSNTLLAELDNSKPKIDESVPIVLVDNRTQVAQELVDNTPKLQAVKLVESITYNDELLADAGLTEEVLDISFGIDYVCEPLPLISPIHYQLLAENDVEPDESELQLSFYIDKIDPLKVVEQFDLYQLTYNDDVFDDTENVEIDFAIDQINALDIISQIPLNELAFNDAEIDENELEINTNIDKINAIKIVEQIDITQLASNDITIEEAIYVDSNVDMIEALEVVSQIRTETIAFNDDEIFESDIEINTAIDQATAIEVIEQIDVTQLVSNDITIEESLDVDSNVDVIEALEIVSQINTETIAFNDDEIFETELDINTAIDQAIAIEVVEQIEITQFVSNDFTIEESLDVDSNVDVIEALEIVSQINTETIAFNDTEVFETELDINNAIDQAITIEVVEQIDVTQLASNDIIIDEVLNVDSNIDAIGALEVVAQINTETIAFNDAKIFESNLEINTALDNATVFEVVEQIDVTQLAFNEITIDENLELDSNVDVIEALEVVAQINTETIAFNDVEIIESELEINTGDKQLNPVALVNPIVYSELAYSTIIPEENNLEINLFIEKVQSVDVPSMINPVVFASMVETAGIEEDLEISFAIDEVLSTENETVLLANATTPDDQSKGKIASERSALSKLNAEQSNFMYYLRESVMKPGTIETDKSDIELLKLALSDYDELSYEELLYAASLAYVVEEKLAIYNIAFVHIDRDWRAFNNAAITAIHGNNLDQADVYLYQASLISSDNGKIQNNMGILACYKKEFNKAEEHFLAAANLGFDAYYNLQVVNNIVDATTDIADNIIINTDINSHEVIGDIIDYGTSED